MDTEFRLLGDVDVRVDGRRVDLGHDRQRSVLVALLSDAGRPVPADRLLERVWAERPPHRARNALSGYVSRLRKALDGSGGAQIRRERGGYVLATDPLAVDLYRFRHLVVRARAEQDPSHAVALFDEALALWHGDPFPTLDGPWFDELRTALVAERRAARLDRTDAALRAGRHAELLGGLAAAVRADPLDERVAAQLMLAQYAGGRQAEALETYQRTRSRLLDELGADPSPPLRRAHERVLTGSVDPDPPQPPAGPAPRSPVATEGNLPRSRTGLVGRGEDVGHVLAALRDGPLVTLTGVGGVGKTRLAVEAAGRDRSRWPDGVWLCELAPLSDGGPVGHALAAALGVQQRQGMTVEQSVIEYLRTRELLLVVDNCEHVLDAAAGVLDQVVALCPGAAVLATSREALGVPGERLVPVDPLPIDDATTLFEHRARANRPTFRVEDEAPGAVAGICRRLDGLPLAIELAAARMRAMNALEVARRLDHDRFVRGTSRGSAPPRHQSLVAAVEWSYRLLDDRERTLFAGLAVFAGGFDLDAAHGVCGEPGRDEDDTLDLLTRLLDKSLVTVVTGAGRSRYRLLETLRAYGLDRLHDEGSADRAGRRHAEYFALLAERAAVGVHGPDECDWVDRVLPDYDNLRAAVERAVADRDGDLALRLVTSVIGLVHVRVGYETADWALRALDLVDGDHPLVAAALGTAARAAWNRGDLDAARTLAGRAGDRVPARGSAHVVYPADVLVDVALSEGDAGPALAHYEAEVARARRDADPVRLVQTLHLVAVCHSVLRAPERGLPAAREAVDLADATGNPTLRSMARYALGLVLKKSEPERALDVLDEAAGLAAAVRNFWWQDVARMEAAATRAVRGEPGTAAGALLEVLERWDRVGDRIQQWLTLRYVVRLLARLGARDPDAAEDAVALHHALVAAGRPSPLDAARLADLAVRPGPVAPTASTAAAAVGRARAALRRYA